MQVSLKQPVSGKRSWGRLTQELCTCRAPDPGSRLNCLASIWEGEAPTEPHCSPPRLVNGDRPARIAAQKVALSLSADRLRRLLALSLLVAPAEEPETRDHRQ